MISFWVQKKSELNRPGQFLFFVLILTQIGVGKLDGAERREPAIDDAKEKEEHACIFIKCKW